MGTQSTRENDDNAAQTAAELRSHSSRQ